MIEIEKANTNERLDPIQFLKMNISATKLISTICPAEIFANNLIINAKGLVNIPIISIGTIIGIKAKGPPGGLKI